MRNLIYPLYVVLAGLMMLLLFVLYGTITDYQPEEVTLLKEQTNASLVRDSVFDLMIWNIGYCGLGSEMDFFYDGGEQVRSKPSRVEANLKHVLEYTASLDSCDFLLFQEVDLRSRRSYRHNQLDALVNGLEGYFASFGKNYDVFFVPLPLKSPYGKVVSGIATLGRMEPLSAVRHAYPGNYPWPKGAFMLDRCFLVNRYMLDGGRQLLVVNTHNSAYDDGTLREGQMDYLRAFLLDEYGKGNFIIVGGDWNQTPAGFEPEFAEDSFDTIQVFYIDDNYLPGDWTWLFDPGVPSNRRLATPYIQGNSPTTLIDFYLLSPNIIPIDIQGIDLGFVSSDHQPVLAKVKLKLDQPEIYNSGSSPASRK